MLRGKSFLTMSGIVALLAMALMWPTVAEASQYKILYKFTGGKNGGYPFSLISDAAGNLYGTTAGGGRGRFDGVVFKLTLNANGSWTESLLHAFCALKNCADGFGPGGALIFDQAGNLYGTAEEGGAYDLGAVFKLTPNGNGKWTETVLHSFNKTDGAGPYGVIFDTAGNLYGVTLQGGTSNQGTVYKLSPNSDGTWTESVLYDFCSLQNCKDGRGPNTLVFDQVGNLYGTTADGGVSCALEAGCGVVFQLAPNSSGGWTETVLNSFEGGPMEPFRTA